MKKVLKIALFMLIPLLLLFIAAFRTSLFYSKKEFADAYIINKAVCVNEFFKKSRRSSEEQLSFLYIKNNSEYTAEFNIDKRFAFENNFPYFEGLSASVLLHNDGDASYLSASVFDSDKTIVQADIYSTKDNSVIAVPTILDGFYSPLPDYIEYNLSDDTDEDEDEEDEDDEDNDDDEDYDLYDILGLSNSSNTAPSLVGYLLSYSSLNPDDAGNLAVQLISDVVSSLPENAYLVSRGAFNKSDITLSISEIELSLALYAAISKNSSDPSFREMIESSFTPDNYDEFIKSFLSGLRSIETSDTNFYTLNIKTGFTGKIRRVLASYIYDGDYRAADLTFFKNRIALKTTSNELFEDEIKRFTEKEWVIVYGLNSDKTLKGYISYAEDEGSAVVYFEDIGLKNSFINGKIEYMIDGARSITAEFDPSNESVLFSYVNNDEPLAALKISRKDHDGVPFSFDEITSGKPYHSYDDFESDLIHSDKYAQFYEDMQIEQLGSWLDTLAQMYLETD